MRSVGLITDPSLTLETFRLALGRRFAVAVNAVTGAPSLVVRDGTDVAWLHPEGDMRAEYDAGTLDVVGLDRMAFFDVPYRSIAFLKRMLLTIADDPRVWVDLDNGVIVAGSELVARLQREPDWLMGLPTVTGD